MDIFSNYFGMTKGQHVGIKGGQAMGPPHPIEGGNLARDEQPGQIPSTKLR